MLIDFYRRTRNLAYFLGAATIGLACGDRGMYRNPVAPEDEPVPLEQKITAQEQERINKTNDWYEKAKQDGIIDVSELQELEGIAEIRENTEKSKYKAVSVAELAAMLASRPNGDVNRDGKENIFDLLALLQVLGGRIAASEASNINGDKDALGNPKTDIFDLLVFLKILSGYYDKAPGINARFNGSMINAADSLNAYNQALIQVSYSNRLDSAFVNVNGERKGDLRSINLNLGVYRILVKAFGNEKESSLEFLVNVLENRGPVVSLYYNGNLAGDSLYLAFNKDSSISLEPKAEADVGILKLEGMINDSSFAVNGNINIPHVNIPYGKEWNVSVIATDSLGKADTASASISLFDAAKPVINVNSYKDNDKVNLLEGALFNVVLNAADDYSGIKSLEAVINNQSGEVARYSGNNISHTFSNANNYTGLFIAADNAGNADTLRLLFEVAKPSVAAKPISNISFNEDEIASNVMDADNYFTANGTVIDSITANGFSNVSVAVDSDRKVSVSNRTKDFNGVEAGKLRAHYGNNYVDNPLTVVVAPMDDLRGIHKDNDTEQATKARLTIDNTVYETDAVGNFDVQKSPGNHTIKARQINELGDSTGYETKVIRINGNNATSINGENIDIELYSVSYPTTVTPKVFKDFMIEGNGGIIKFYNEGNMKYILMITSPFGEQYNLTSADMDFIEKIIREKIFTAFNFEIPIERKDASYTFPPKDQRKNIIHVFGYYGYFVGTTIENNIIISGNSYMYAGHVDDEWLDQAMTELASPIFMPFEIGISLGEYYDKSAFYGGSELTEFTVIDKKAYKLCRRFRGIYIDDVLGL